jgi:hypothetical protein
VNVVWLVAPFESVTVIVMVLYPFTSGMEADHDVVPDAVPLAPERPFDQLTEASVAGDLALAVPLTVIGDDDELDGGEVTETLGGGPDVPVVYVTSSCGRYCAVAYSLLASRKLRFEVVESIIPLLFAGVATQLCTRDAIPVIV